MTLAMTVSKKSVTKVMDKLWNITMNLTLTDDGKEVLNNDYSVRYRPGDDISAKEKTLADMMQEDIAKYKSEQQVYHASALDDAVTNVQEALVVTKNVFE